MLDCVKTNIETKFRWPVVIQYFVCFEVEVVLYAAAILSFGLAILSFGLVSAFLFFLGTLNQLFSCKLCRWWILHTPYHKKNCDYTFPTFSTIKQNVHFCHLIVCAATLSLLCRPSLPEMVVMASPFTLWVFARYLVFRFYPLHLVDALPSPYCHHCGLLAPAPDPGSLGLVFYLCKISGAFLALSFKLISVLLLYSSSCPFTFLTLIIILFLFGARKLHILPSLLISVRLRVI